MSESDSMILAKANRNTYYKCEGIMYGKTSCVKGKMKLWITEIFILKQRI